MDRLVRKNTTISKEIHYQVCFIPKNPVTSFNKLSVISKLYIVNIIG